MKLLKTTLMMLLLGACSATNAGDHTVLLEASQSEWTKASLEDRSATAHFWTWDLAGRPGPEMRDTIDKAAENMRECIDAAKIDNPDLKARTTAKTCWDILASY